MAKHDVNAPPSLRLTITDGFSKGKVFESKALGLTITVGRSKKKNTIPLFKPDISEMHASFQWDGNCWRVRDLDSSNGTQVNDGRKLMPYVSHELHGGDKVKLGGVVEMTVELEPQAVGEMTVEELLRSFFAARANTMEERGIQQARAMQWHCTEALEALLKAE